MLERSWHVLTEDVERDLVARLTIDFLTRVEASVTPCQRGLRLRGAGSASG